MVQDEPVHDLDRGRPVLEEGRRGAERVEQIVELDRQYRRGGRQRDEVHPGLDHQAERAFRADDQVGEVERACGVGKRVEVVAADPSEDLGIAAVHLGGVFDTQPAHRPIAPPLERVRRADRVELVRRQRPQMDDGAVADRHVEIEYVVDRLAVEHRACPTGVVADHAADGGPAGGGDVGGELQPVGEQMRVQLGEHDAWFDTCPALGDVHLEHAVEVLGRVQLEPGANSLPRLRGAAATRGDRDAVSAGDLDRADDVVAGSDDNDPGRLDLIDAGVGGVEGASEGVEADVALDRGLQIAPQPLGHQRSIIPALSSVAVGHPL